MIIHVTTVLYTNRLFLSMIQLHILLLHACSFGNNTSPETSEQRSNGVVKHGMIQKKVSQWYALKMVIKWKYFQSTRLAKHTHNFRNSSRNLFHRFLLIVYIMKCPVEWIVECSRKVVLVWSYICWITIVYFTNLEYTCWVPKLFPELPFHLIKAQSWVDLTQNDIWSNYV